MADARERESIVAYYATDCPADDMVHEMENGRCKKCDYSMRDPASFIARFKHKYATQTKKQIAEETARMFARVQSKRPENPQTPAESDAEPPMPPGFNGPNFAKFAMD
jgi:hypothetical protein